MRRFSCVFFVCLLSVVLFSGCASTAPTAEPEPAAPERFSAEAAALIPETALLEFEADAAELESRNGILWRLLTPEGEASATVENRELLLVTDGEGFHCLTGPGFTERQSWEIASILSYCSENAEDFSDYAERIVRSLYHYGATLQDRDFNAFETGEGPEPVRASASLLPLYVTAGLLLALTVLILVIAVSKRRSRARVEQRRERRRQEARSEEDDLGDWGSPV